MRGQLVLTAYAKINLSLNILSKRSDGYHEIDTVMQSVGLFDLLTISRSDTFSFCCTDRALEQRENTVVRAALAYFDEIGKKPMSRLKLYKRVPYQAGLGSASADAAAALIGLNIINNNALPQDRMMRLAAQIGSDVPFCMLGGLARATGRGEKVTALPPDLRRIYYVISKPSEGMPTREAYEKFDTLDNDLLLKRSTGLYSNDFELVCPVSRVFEIKGKLLRLGAAGAAMTGSGTAVYGAFLSLAAARRAEDKLRETGVDTRLTTAVNCGVSVLNDGSL